MTGAAKTDAAQLLTLSDQEVVSLTQRSAIPGLSRRELQALVRRLREACYRARDIARQQRREMRGKAEPRGATPASDDLRVAAKEQVLREALERVTQELRGVRFAAPAFSASEVLNPRPSEGPPAESKARMAARTRLMSQEARAKPSKLPTVHPDPREVGRVSKAVKSAQVRRDAKFR